MQVHDHQQAQGRDRGWVLMAQARSEAQLCKFNVPHRHREPVNSSSHLGLEGPCATGVGKLLPGHKDT